MVCTLTFLGDAPRNPISILVPFQPDSISYDKGKTVLVSVAKNAGSKLCVSTQWETEKVININTKMAKDEFVKEFYKTFEPKTTIQFLSYSLKIFKGYTKPESLTFAYTDTMSVRKLWQTPQFAQFIKKVQQSRDADNVLVTLRGWIDSTYTTIYDDPNNEERALYKLHIQLIPGLNNIYCSTVDRRDSAMVYSSSLVIDSKANADRTNHFHNSRLEQSCTVCHDGLPSADSGASMKADCNVCHKAMSAGPSYLHSPAEMKECTTCHSWSAENKIVVVEKGVPTVCYDCHSEKQAQVENSNFPHPVASECITCHSPHGTDQKHIVKTRIYDLCVGCHEEQKVNHPVGRHPLRFNRIYTGEEISCVSCHNPHGSENENLLKAQGGRMEICEQCH